MQKISDEELMDCIYEVGSNLKIKSKIKDSKMLLLFFDYHIYQSTITNQNIEDSSFLAAAIICNLFIEKHIMQIKQEDYDLAIRVALKLCEEPIEYYYGEDKPKIYKRVSFDYLYENKELFGDDFNNRLVKLIGFSSDNKVDRIKKTANLFKSIYMQALDQKNNNTGRRK